MSQSDTDRATPRPVFSRLHCHGSRRDRVCDRFLGYVTAAVRFVELAERAPDAPDGRTWSRCPECKVWNVYEASE